MSKNTFVFISPYVDENGENCKFSALGEYTASVVNIIKQDIEEICVLCQKGDFASYSKDNVLVLPSWQRDTYSGLFTLCKYILQNRFSIKILHIQHEVFAFSSSAPKSVLYYFLLQLLSKILLINTVTTIHGVVDKKYLSSQFIQDNNLKTSATLTRLIYKLHMYFVCAFSNKIVVHSDKIRNILGVEYKVSKKKVHVIPIPLYSFNTSTTLTKSEIVEELKNAKKCVVLFFGHIAPYRGLDIAVEAFSILAKELPNVFLLISGSIPKRYALNKNYTSKIAEYKNLPNVQLDQRFVPNSEMSNLFKHSDLLILPYKQVIASSGPMAYAVKFGTPFLCSSEFKDVVNESFIYGSSAQDLAQKIKSYFSNAKDSQILRSLVAEYKNAWSDTAIKEKYQKFYKEQS